MSVESRTAAIPSRREVIAEHRAGDGLVCAAFPISYPRELLRSFGVLPVEVWAPPSADASLADRWIQSYICGVVKGGLAFLTGGGFDRVDMVLVPHGCDSLQGLGSLLIDFPVSSKPTLTFYTPRAPHGSHEPLDFERRVDFLEGELLALARRLSALTGRPLDLEALGAATRREEQADALVGSLLAARADMGGDCREFYRRVRSREWLPAERFIELATSWLREDRAPARDLAPILLSGVVPEPASMLDSINEAGAFVAADDTIACGRRLHPAGRASEPLRRVAERLAAAPHCSTRGGPVAARVERLLSLAESSSARAVIFAVVKFCEPELFYLPQVRSRVEEAGLRTLTLELESSGPLSHQAKTRIEALVETIT